MFNWLVRVWTIETFLLGFIAAVVWSCATSIEPHLDLTPLVVYIGCVIGVNIMWSIVTCVVDEKRVRDDVRKYYRSLLVSLKEIDNFRFTKAWSHAFELMQSIEQISLVLNNSYDKKELTYLKYKGLVRTLYRADCDILNQLSNTQDVQLSRKLINQHDEIIESINTACKEIASQQPVQYHDSMQQLTDLTKMLKSG